jgi:hypothetical protein
MEVKFTYNKQQLELAVKFIARNNSHFQGQTDYIRNSIMEHMREIASKPGRWMGGTMGYLLLADREDEGMDSDSNLCRFDIHVDPAIGMDYELAEYVDEMVDASEEIED